MILLFETIKNAILRPGRRLRFAAAGGINTVFGMSLFPALLWMSPWLYRNYIAGLIISQTICTILAFIIHKFVVFRTKSENVLQEFWKFVSFYLVNYAVNIATLPILVTQFRISPIIAQIGFSLAVFVGGYFWHSYITFRSKPEVT